MFWNIKEQVKFKIISVILYHILFYIYPGTYYLIQFCFLFLELNIPLDDNRLKEAKTIVFEYADSKLPRQGSNEGEPPNVNQQRLHSERPPPEVVQAIGMLFSFR